MRVGIFLIFGLACVAGMATDMLASIFGLIAWLKADYWIAKILIGGFGIIVTFAVAGTKYVIQGKAPLVLSFLWLLCAIVDLCTTVVGLVHFVVVGGTLKDDVATGFSEIFDAMQSAPDKSVVVAVMTAAVMSATIGGPYCFDAIAPPQKTGQNP